jgi:hypothetical protein
MCRDEPGRLGRTRGPERTREIGRAGDATRRISGRNRGSAGRGVSGFPWAEGLAGRDQAIRGHAPGTEEGSSLFVVATKRRGQQTWNRCSRGEEWCQGRAAGSVGIRLPGVNVGDGDVARLSLMLFRGFRSGSGGHSATERTNLHFIIYMSHRFVSSFERLFSGNRPEWLSLTQCTPLSWNEHTNPKR